MPATAMKKNTEARHADAVTDEPVGSAVRCYAFPLPH